MRATQSRSRSRLGFASPKIRGVSCAVDALSAPSSQQQGGGLPHGWWTSNAITPVSGQSELIFGLDGNDIGTHPITFTATSAGFSAVVTSGFSSDEAYVFASHRIVASTSGSYTSSGASDNATNGGYNDPWIVAFRSTGIPTALMSNTGTVTNSTGRVKYRLSAGSAQPAGTYTTVITYTIYAAY